MWQDSLSLNKHSLKTHIDLRQIAEQILGQPARRSSRYVQYHAPARRDSSPSLTIWADGFKDFGTDDSGDLFAFLLTYANLPYQDAVQFLTDASGLSCRPTSIDHADSASTHDPARHHPSSAWQAAVSGLLQRAQHTLWHTPAGDQARAYLESQGYSPATIQTRGLGLNLRWHRLHLDGEWVWIAPGILYPWWQSGLLFGVKIRLPYQRDGQPDELAQSLKQTPGPMKYMQVRGSCLAQAWYGEITNPALPLVLVEGEKDRDNLWQRGADRFNIITLGSATGRIPEALWSHLQKAAWIAVLLDNDAAGQTNAARLVDQLNARLVNRSAFALALPTSHKDPTDWLLSGADLSAWLTTIRPPAAQPDVPANLPAPDQPLFFHNGLPDALRELLLGLHQLTPQGRAYIADHSPAALILEIITEAFRQNLLATDRPAFTIKRLTEIAVALQRHTSPKTIRRGLDQLQALGFVELFPFSTPIKPFPNKQGGGENGNNSIDPAENRLTTATTRGRPAQKYTPRDLRQALPQFLEKLADRLRESLYAAAIPDTVQPAWFESITTDLAHQTALAQHVAAASCEVESRYADERDAAEEELDLRLMVLRTHLKWSILVKSPSTPIPPELPFTSGRAYRDAYYQAKVAAAGEQGRQISRARAAAEIGVNSRTLSRVRERVGIVTEAQYKEYRLFSSIDVVDQANSIAKWAANRPFGRFLKSSDGSCITLRLYDSAFNDEWVAAQLAQGRTVTLQVQVASREHLATPEEAHQQRQRRVHRAQRAHHRSGSQSATTAQKGPAPIQFRRVLHAQLDAAGCEIGVAPIIVPHRSSAAPLAQRDSVAPLGCDRTPKLEPTLCGLWGEYRFALAYVRDQLALRLPYLTPALQSYSGLREAITKIMLTAPNLAIINPSCEHGVPVEESSILWRDYFPSEHS